MRKLELQYGEFIDVEYHMGGLLPSWEEYSKGMISNPSDAARLWDDMAHKHHMPLDGDIWIEDPLDSSYPPSIAFKAAQIQDSDKAISFLRRMKEMLFVEKKNINKWEHLEKAALTSGLDAALLRKDIAGQGHQRFMEDLKHAQELGIHVFPTLIFKVDGFSRLSLRGYQPYDRIEEYISKYVKGAKPAEIGLNVAQLFDKFNQLNESEIAFILDMDSSAVNEELELLAAQDIIQAHHIKNGSYWTLS